MKKVFILLFLFLLFSCTDNVTSSSSSMSSNIISDNISSSNETSSSEDNSSSEDESSNVLSESSSNSSESSSEILDGSIRIKIDGKSFDYKFVNLIQDEKQFDEEILFENKDDVLFLVMGEGNLTIKNTTIYKSDSLNEANMKYGQTACIFVLGPSARVTIENCVLNLSSDYSSLVTCLDGGTCSIINCDITITGSFSNGFITYNHGKIFLKDIFVFVDNKNINVFYLFEGDNLIQITGNNTIEIYEENSLVGYVKEGTLQISNLHGSSVNKVLFVNEKDGQIKIENNRMQTS